MACKPCDDKKAKQAKEQSDAPEKSPVEAVLEQNPTKLAIDCVCGLRRIIPRHLKFGDHFNLTPCPRCGLALRYRFAEDGVYEII